MARKTNNLGLTIQEQTEFYDVDILNANFEKLDTEVFDKVKKNPCITGGTKTKITFDEKGLVTGGEDLTPDDIPNIHVSKIQGLENVDNTADSVKNVLSATKLTIARKINGIYFDGSKDITIEDSTKIPITQKGVAGGIAELDENGFVPSSQLPSYVDDVIEGTIATFPNVGENGKIYIDTDTGFTYRWSGTQYTEISTKNIVLGETSSTAYAGDKGKQNAENIEILNERITSAETALQTQLDAKAPKNHTHETMDITDFPLSMKNPNSLHLTINGTASAYNGESAISKSWYAPTSAGTSGYELVSSGGTPVWKAPSYSVCTTAAATVTKTVSITNFKLVTGVKVVVKFTYTNTASSPKLNVGGTGAKLIMHKGFGVPKNYLSAGNVYEFVYDGSYWQLIGDNECGTDVYNVTGDISKTTINSTNYPGIKSFRFAPMTYSNLTIKCTSSCEFVGTGDIPIHYYAYAGTSYDTKTKFTEPVISATKSVTFRNLLFETTSECSIINETSSTSDVRYQFIDCDFCLSNAKNNTPLFILRNSSIEFINCRFYMNVSTTAPCYHIVDSTKDAVGTVTVKLINSIVNYSSATDADTVFATTNGGATKVIISNSYLNNANPIKATAEFKDGFGISIDNTEFDECNRIGSGTTYSSLTKGYFLINNCRFGGSAETLIYASGNLVNVSENTFEKSPTVYLHGTYNIFSNNVSDETVKLYEYGKGAITGNVASSFTQSVSSSTYAKTGNYPTIS